MTLFAIGDGNFDLYLVKSPTGDYLRSVPKYNNGCVETVFGSVKWFMLMRKRNPEMYEKPYKLI